MPAGNTQLACRANKTKPVPQLRWFGKASSLSITCPIECEAVDHRVAPGSAVSSIPSAARGSCILPEESRTTKRVPERFTSETWGLGPASAIKKRQTEAVHHQKEAGFRSFSNWMSGLSGKTTRNLGLSNRIVAGQGARGRSKRNHQCSNVGIALCYPGFASSKRSFNPNHHALNYPNPAFCRFYWKGPTVTSLPLTPLLRGPYP